MLTVSYNSIQRVKRGYVDFLKEFTPEGGAITSSVKEYLEEWDDEVPTLKEFKKSEKKSEKLIRIILNDLMNEEILTESDEPLLRIVFEREITKRTLNIVAGMIG